MLLLLDQTFLFCVDFNINCQKTNLNKNLLLDIMNSHNLGENMKGATRVFTNKNSHTS